MNEGCNKTCTFSALSWSDYSILLEWLFCITLSAHHLVLCEEHHLLLFGAVWRTLSAIIWCCVKDTICYYLVLREGHYLLLFFVLCEEHICSSFGTVWRTPSAHHLVLCEGHYLLIIWCCVKMEKEHPNVSALVRDGGDRSEGQKPSRLLTSGYSEQNFATIIYAFFHVWYFIFVLLYIYICVCVCVCVCGWVCSMYGNANCLVSVWPLHARKKCSTQLNSSLQNRNYRC